MAQGDLRITCVRPAMASYVQSLLAEPASREIALSELATVQNAEAAQVVRLELIVDDGAPQLQQLQIADLGAFTKLRALRYKLIWSPVGIDQSAVLAVWGGVLQTIRTLPESVVLTSIIIEGPFPWDLLRIGWSRSEIIKAVRKPLYCVDKRLVGLVDRGEMLRVVVVPLCARASSAGLQGQPLLENEQIRIRDLFQALSAYDMLAFPPTGPSCLE
ncbi:hypothetical protein PHLGIDRAFT_15480 [Phlebiopsis gigantea 11061_1 CR5-6]|uniref:Uncharacterized protein n=1 Tax=Phlebiopsis gigantea (strain 11061_1 CR5-6) TaxID=745531 RepID=A0A0C3S6A5_PHLG1|nr:hypothetical protein PHLGIDRAFT_15480 [Phlebiopsis gigantea 11061_1 CR5-6]